MGHEAMMKWSTDQQLSSHACATDCVLNQLPASQASSTTTAMLA